MYYHSMEFLLSHECFIVDIKTKICHRWERTLRGRDAIDREIIKK